MKVFQLHGFCSLAAPQRLDLLWEPKLCFRSFVGAEPNESDWVHPLPNSAALSSGLQRAPSVSLLWHCLWERWSLYALHAAVTTRLTLVLPRLCWSSMLLTGTLRCEDVSLVVPLYTGCESILESSLNVIVWCKVFSSKILHTLTKVSQTEAPLLSTRVSH